MECLAYLYLLPFRSYKRLSAFNRTCFRYSYTSMEPAGPVPQVTDVFTSKAQHGYWSTEASEVASV
jgi:hypothetical protein